MTLPHRHGALLTIRTVPEARFHGCQMGLAAERERRGAGAASTGSAVLALAILHVDAAADDEDDDEGADGDARDGRVGERGG